MLDETASVINTDADLTFYIAMKKVHFYYSDFMIMVVCSIDWQFSENLIYNFIYSRV